MVIIYFIFGNVWYVFYMVLCFCYDMYLGWYYMCYSFEFWVDCSCCYYSYGINGY